MNLQIDNIILVHYAFNLKSTKNRKNYYLEKLNDKEIGLVFWKLKIVEEMWNYIHAHYILIIQRNLKMILNEQPYIRFGIIIYMLYKLFIIRA